MTEHPIYKLILDEIVKAGYWHEATIHEVKVRTAEEAAAQRPHYTLAEGTKSLILRVKIPHVGKAFAMAVIEGDKKFDTKKFKVAAGANDLRFATEAEVAELTNGIQPGGVPPVGNMFGIATYVDKGVLTHDKLIFNAGRDASIALYVKDYLALVNPTVAEIV
jgi:Ala-tRNA(Pro) deacylase